MDALRKALGSPSSNNAYIDDEESGILSSINDDMSLSWSTRIKGFCILFLLGFVLSMMGSTVLFFGKIRLFAVLYTLGNITSIGSTLFLVGPMKQLKNITAPTRLITSITVLLAFIATLLAVFLLHNALLAIIFVIIQSLAMTWYSLSYIPFARDAVMKMLSCCF